MPKIFPKNVEKAVLINHQLHGFQSDNFKKFADIRQNHPVYGPALENFRRFASETPSTDEEFEAGLGGFLSYYMHDTDKTYLFANGLKGGTTHAWNFHRQKECDANLSAIEGLGRVKADVLVISGKVDFICAEESARKAAEGIGSNAKLVLIEEAGHLPWLEKPDEFFTAVKQFLNS